MKGAACDAFRAQFEAGVAPGEPSALAGLRADAFALFEDQGLPGPKNEDWRFTPLTSLARVPFAAATSGASLPQAVPARAGASHRIAFVNGAFSAELSTLSELPDGVEVAPLGPSLRGSAFPLGRLGELADCKTRALTALNTALFRDGAWIRIGEELALEQPIEILNLVAAGDDSVALHPRNLIEIGAGSRVTLVEHTAALGKGLSLSNPVTEVFVARDANVEHVKLQEEAPKAFHLAALAVRQEAGSRFASHSLALGAELGRVDITCTLAGGGAHAALYGLYLGRGRQLLDHHTTIDHASPHTTSDELYKGILDGRAHGVFHGRIHVRPHAQKIQAMQNNRNLLLSDQCVVNTKPQLEIFADDVRCSHGAAIGQLDPDHVFYLQSRGIEREAAQALLVLAFASELVRKLPGSELPGYLEQVVLDWLAGGENA